MIDDKPSLDELEHHGVKGMRWGVRRASLGQRLASSRFGKTANENARRYQQKQGSKGKTLVMPNPTKGSLKVGVGVMAVGGAILAASIIASRGRVPVSSVKNLPFVTGTPPKIALMRSQTAWKMNVNRVLADMAQANKEQDQWMRSMGLGHIVNNKTGL